LPIAMTRAVADRANTRLATVHIRTSKPVTRPDEGMSFSCFSRDILTRRGPVKGLRETTRRSPQRTLEERTFGGARNLPWEVTHIHQAGMLLHGGHTHGMSTKTVATLQRTVGCRTAGRRKSHGWCTGAEPSGAYCGRETSSDEGGHRRHQRPGGHQRYRRPCSNKLRLGHTKFKPFWRGNKIGWVR